MAGDSPFLPPLADPLEDLLVLQEKSNCLCSSNGTSWYPTKLMAQHSPNHRA